MSCDYATEMLGQQRNHHPNHHLGQPCPSWNYALPPLPISGQNGELPVPSLEVNLWLLENVSTLASTPWEFVPNFSYQELYFSRPFEPCGSLLPFWRPRVRQGRRVQYVRGKLDELPSHKVEEVEHRDCRGDYLDDVSMYYS
jgi:hypothetical protein